MSNTILVTRHPALRDFALELGLIDENTPSLTHVSVEDVEGKDVIGVLPHHLSCHANSITEVALNIPAKMRGQELSLEQVRQYATGVSTYQVRRRKHVSLS